MYHVVVKELLLLNSMHNDINPDSSRIQWNCR